MNIDVETRDIEEIFKKLPQDANRLSTRKLVYITKRLLRICTIHPRKSLGQHFLVDAKIYRIILENVKNFNRIIEIGPGIGILTYYLSSNSYVIAVELDKKFLSCLKVLKRIRNSNLEILISDALKVRLMKNSLVFSNLPYYITSDFLVKVVKDLVTNVLVMVQREVASRLLARPGSSDYGRLSVLVSCFYNVRKVCNVDRRCFIPVPEVDSCIVKLSLKDRFCIDYKYLQHFEKLTSILFSQRNKHVNKVLREFFNIEMKIFESKRVFQLSPSDIALILEKVINSM